MAPHVPANCDLNLSIAFLKRAPTPLRHRIPLCPLPDGRPSDKTCSHLRGGRNNGQKPPLTQERLAMDLTFWTPRMLSVPRIVTGLLFLEHGTGKLLGFPPSDHAAPTLFSLIGVQGALELVGGLLILIGLFTRPVAFVLAGDMAVAYFMAMHLRASFRHSTEVSSPSCSASCSFIWRSQAEASGAPMSLWRAHARGDYLDRATIIILGSFCV